jgi:DNA modification methylase
MPTLGKVDAVVTDPPYGIGFNYASHDDGRYKWFILMNNIIPQLRYIADFVVMPSCGIDRMGWWYENHNPDWLLSWYKGSPGHLSHVGFNDWEAHLVWGKPPKQMHDYFQSACGFDNNGHPCPKPMPWATWLVKRAALRNETILDPFMGSGTTGVACAKLGRKFIGIEIEPKYFDISCERIQKAYDQPDMFIEQPKAVQARMEI